MEGNVAATYALIYRFLRAQSRPKAAEAVKKAAKSIVTLRDDVEQEGPPLEDIVKEWQTKKSTTSEDADSSSESSGSSDDATSHSKDGASSSSEDTSESENDDGDTSDDDSDEGAKTKLPIKGAERDTSVTLSSAEGNSREATKKANQVPEKKSSRDESEEDSSESDGSSNSSVASDSSDAETSSGSSDSSSGSDSSDDQENTNKNTRVLRGRCTVVQNSSSPESSSDSEDESGSEPEQKADVRVTKRRKTSEGGAAVTTAVDTGSEQVATQKRAKLPAKVRERFQRVRVKDLPSELLLDNGYKARGGASNDYGERAHHDLIVTRGAGFRKEKNKKKRGSYRGGEITMENRSIKFDY